MQGVSLFRRVSVLTAVFAYFQIALGGVVRVSGSGLGCPDWPLCHGRPYPPANLHAIIEYSHRTVGVITGLLLVATVIGAWMVFRNRRPLVAWLATATLIPYGTEAILGAAVVANELPPWLVAVHLGLAMLILACLIATAVLAFPEFPGVTGLGRPAALAVAGTYVLLLTGSSVVASNADAQCHSWPLCGGGFAIDFTGPNAFTMLHRGSALLIGLVLVYFLWTTLTRSSDLRLAAIITLAVLLLQVVVGAASAVTDAAFANGLHVALATLVWSSVLTTALLAAPRADRAAVHTRLEVGRTAV